MLPDLNDCSSVEEINQMNGKLVKFDCMVQDMYEEEFFSSVLIQKDSLHAETEEMLATSLYYKYYSGLSQDQIDKFDTGYLD